MHKPLVTTLVAVTLITTTAPVRTAAAAAYVPAALRVAPATTTVAAPASSEGESFESLVDQARAKFKEKDYVGAVALFERAYATQPEPAILFNIGRIYEEANNVDAAIAYYEKFIADESVEMAQRDKALQRLQALEKIVEIRKKEEAKRNPPPNPPAGGNKTGDGAGGGGNKVDTPPPGPGPGPQPPIEDKPPPQPNRLLRPIGYSMFGLGAALLIGGGIAGGLAKTQHNNFAFAETLDARRDAAQKGKSLAVTADGLFIAGGVLAAVGIVLLLLPKGRKSRAAQALRPQVSPGQMGLGYVYRF